MGLTNASAETPQGAVSAPSATREINAPLWLLLVYLAYFIMTPENRFPLIGAIHFERILVLLIIAALFVSRKEVNLLDSFGVSLLVFFLWCVLSHVLSPYRDDPESIWWIQNYWKLLFFYFLLLASIRRLPDLTMLILGICAISFLYQAYSWLDFVRGGSYVYQQGLKRMIGVWSDGGRGAANAFAFLGMFSLSMAVFWHSVARRRGYRLLALAFLVTCLASIVFSGTRGAVLGAVFVLSLTYARKVFKLRIILAAGVLVYALVLVLPEEHKQRYLGVIWTEEDLAHEKGEFDDIARESAESRVQGLVDGWLMALRRPLLGYGPGTSKVARTLVNEEADRNAERGGEYLQLHNLYGQVMSETGFVGTGLFLLVLGVYGARLRGLRKLRAIDAESRNTMNAHRVLLRNTMLLLIFYGMFTHSLFRFYWLVLFAAQAALAQLSLKAQAAAPARTGGGAGDSA